MIEQQWDPDYQWIDVEGQKVCGRKVTLSPSERMGGVRSRWGEEIFSPMFGGSPFLVHPLGVGGHVGWALFASN